MGNSSPDFDTLGRSPVVTGSSRQDGDESQPGVPEAADSDDEAADVVSPFPADVTNSLRDLQLDRQQDDEVPSMDFKTLRYYSHPQTMGLTEQVRHKLARFEEIMSDPCGETLHQESTLTEAARRYMSPLTASLQAMPNEPNSQNDVNSSYEQDIIWRVYGNSRDLAIVKLAVFIHVMRGLSPARALGEFVINIKVILEEVPKIPDYFKMALIRVAQALTLESTSKWGPLGWETPEQTNRLLCLENSRKAFITARIPVADRGTESPWRTKGCFGAFDPAYAKTQLERMAMHPPKLVMEISKPLSRRLQYAFGIVDHPNTDPTCSLALAPVSPLRVPKLPKLLPPAKRERSTKGAQGDGSFTTPKRPRTDQPQSSKKGWTKSAAPKSDLKVSSKETMRLNRSVFLLTAGPDGNRRTHTLEDILSYADSNDDLYQRHLGALERPTDTEVLRWLSTLGRLCEAQDEIKGRREERFPPLPDREVHRGSRRSRSPRRHLSRSPRRR